MYFLLVYLLIQTWETDPSCDSEDLIGALFFSWGHAGDTYPALLAGTWPIEFGDSPVAMFDDWQASYG